MSSKMKPEATKPASKPTTRVRRTHLLTEPWTVATWIRMKVHKYEFSIVTSGKMQKYDTKTDKTSKRRKTFDIKFEYQLHFIFR